MWRGEKEARNGLKESRVDLSMIKYVIYYIFWPLTARLPSSEAFSLGDKVVFVARYEVTDGGTFEVWREIPMNVQILTSGLLVRAK